MGEIWYGDNLCKNCKKNQVDNGWSTCDECIDKFADMGNQNND
jgi:hypothetical protein